MGTTALTATKYAYVSSNFPGNVNSNPSQPIERAYGAYPRLFLSFGDLPSNLRFKPITGLALKLSVSVLGNVTCSALNYPKEGQLFDIDSVSFSNMPLGEASPDIPSGWSAGVSDYSAPRSSTVTTAPDVSAVHALGILKRKALWIRTFHFDQSSAASGRIWSELSIDTPLSAAASRPQVIVYYDDTNVGLVIEARSQSGGYLNPHIPQTFAWNCQAASENSLETPTQTNAVFAWKAAGSSTVHTVSIPDGTTEIQIAAETFPAASSIQWQARVTSSGGGTYNSPWYSLSTADTLATATPTAPVTSVEDGSRPITFRWALANDSGSTPTKSVIETSTDGGTTWTQLAQISGDGTSYTAAANTFQAGQVNWRVRAYNIDNVAGPWGEASFTVFAAPPTPYVSTDGRPFASISWQSSGQQAYEITIDGSTVYGPFYGTAKAFKLPLPLEDGEHSASVRIQGVYGIWSEPGTVNFVVTNQPGVTITLQAEFGIDAVLSWTTTSTIRDYLIFRDGALIGHTPGLSFTDRAVLGKHSYYVLLRRVGTAAGYYTKTNVVEGKMCTRYPQISKLSGGSWIPLRLSEKSPAEQRFSWSRTHSLRHVTGAKFPVLELSPYEDASGSYDASFLRASDAAAFEQLRGETVILKSREGKVVIGALTSISEVVNSFYLAFQFTLEQIHWEDFIDDANS